MQKMAYDRVWIEVGSSFVGKKDFVFFGASEKEYLFLLWCYVYVSSLVEDA